MQYQITSDNIEISDSMKVLAEEKFSKIEERLTEKEKEEALVRMVLNKGSAEDEFKVKIELSYGGKKYFATEHDYLLESAIIKAVGEVERMRKRDDISHIDDWKKQREIKREVVGEVEEIEVETKEDDFEEVIDSALEDESDGGSDGDGEGDDDGEGE